MRCTRQSIGHEFKGTQSGSMQEQIDALELFYSNDRIELQIHMSEGKGARGY